MFYYEGGTTMDLQLEVALIGALQMVVVAIVTGWFARDSKKRKKQLDKAEKSALNHAIGEAVVMSLAESNRNTGEVVIMALMDLIPDKDSETYKALETALSESRKAGSTYQDFVRSAAARQLGETNQ